MPTSRLTCDGCHGVGTVAGKMCTACAGTGVTNPSKAQIKRARAERKAATRPGSRAAIQRQAEARRARDAEYRAALGLSADERLPKSIGGVEHGGAQPRSKGRPIKEGDWSRRGGGPS